MSDPRLQQAMDLIRSGELEKARHLLGLLLKDDRSNVAAWQLYADTFSDAEDKKRVWDLHLKYNPHNPEAAEEPGPRKSSNAAPASETKVAREGTASSRLSSCLLWGSIGLFVVLAAAAIAIIQLISTKDPVRYRHTKPVEYYLYVPESYSADRQWPLFVGIHGAGQNGLDCWNLWQRYADTEGYILLCPSIPGDDHGFYQDVGEKTVWRAIEAVKKEVQIQPRMFFSGFSAGAFFIQGFLYHYPQSVSGLSILSAGLYLDPSQFKALVPMVVVIGGQDDHFARQTSMLFAAELQQIGFDVKYVLLPEVGHVVTQEGLDQTLELFRKTTGK